MRLLSTDTRQALEQQESERCDKAIEKVDLNGGPVADVSVYSVQAAVELRGGDTVFIEDTKQGWRVSAAGCRPAGTASPRTATSTADARPLWDRTLQNWQSEFLAVGSMAVLSVYLRQRGSPESKPVGAPHEATGVEG